MQLNLDHFRTLVPINSLDEEQVQTLARHTRVEQHGRGATLFCRGDSDPDTLYLLQGEIELESANGQSDTVSPDSQDARHALAGLKPRRYTGRVTSDHAVVARISGDLLERLLSLIPNSPSGTDNGMEIQDISYEHGAEDSEWMMSMLQSPAFLRLPAANIQSLFERLQEVPVEAGETILEQGQTGDFFYLLKEGTAGVTRKSGANEVRLATLNPPQSFGEEALLSDEPRNASVRMETDGVLMRLSKGDFQDLLREPLVNWVDLQQAGHLVREGAVRVDVRTEQEFQASSLSSALNIPLYLLRLKLPKLDKQRKYILFCDTGTRSAAAGFLLSQHGFNNVSVLKGGLAATSA